jgi:valyl-tRNA synthetase
MDKIYKHQDIENKWYELWEKGRYFTPKIDPSKKPFTILLPLPNANDPMHMGHALFTVQDILVRFHRMKGDPTLWLPGGDHAGIETQYVFEKYLSKQGKSRFDFDRETLYKMIAEFVEKNKNINRDQMKRLGFSLDWTRYHYSLEPAIVETVLDTFRQLYKDGLVYRDERLVNYCTRCGTGFSDLEVKDQETEGILYFINFPLVRGGFIRIATTRPETILGDVAVMVNPKDKRYKNLVGETVILPVTGRKIPIIADEYVDMKFGTGAVKVTPSHDFNDFEIAKKHNLYYPPVIGFDGKIQNTKTDYDGLKVLQARTRMTDEDERIKNLIVEKRKHKMVVKTCYKCGRVLEPLPLPQWYVKMKPLAAPAIKAVKEGKTKIVPLKRFEKIYFDWLENILDWNISRQIVWGPRLPVWYKVDGNEQKIWVSFLINGEVRQGSFDQHLKDGYTFDQIVAGLQRLLIPLYENKENQPEVYVGIRKPESGRWIQETDTFDTWFLSSQWPLTTLGFPGSDDFRYFYPTSVLDTMWDILFFWVARMMMMGLYRAHEVPFKIIHLHCRIVDSKGQKMAKSRGNVMNPIEMVDKYGADALRFALIFGASPGSDIAISDDKIRGMRNFSNKLWNIGRFIKMNSENFAGNNIRIEEFDPKAHRGHLLPDDKKILSQLGMLSRGVTKNIENYRFDKAAERLYEFTWHTFADKYIEGSKEELRKLNPAKLAILVYVYRSCLALLHPFMPFITEEISAQLAPNKTPLIVSPWPKV